MKILIIEDHDIQFKLLMLKLRSNKSLKLDIQRATSLSEALKLLDNNDFQLIVCDLILPDAKDYESFDAVYQKASNVPIIVLTGKDDIKDANEVLEKGAALFLPKNRDYANMLNNAIVAQIEKLYLSKNE